MDVNPRSRGTAAFLRGHRINDVVGLVHNGIISHGALGFMPTTHMLQANLMHPFLGVGVYHDCQWSNRLPWTLELLNTTD